MRTRWLAIAIAAIVVASACSSKRESPSATAGSGSAVGAGSAVGSGSAAGSGSADAACDDADIAKHIDASLAVSLEYLDALEKRTAAWKQDCEAAKKDLLALEPEALRFMEAMLEFRGWAQSLSDTCRQRVSELGETSKAAIDIENRTPAIETKIKPILERCQAHPGFQDAATKGLRVMRRKST